jgi:hypothetical protein
LIHGNRAVRQYRNVGREVRDEFVGTEVHLDLIAIIRLHHNRGIFLIALNEDFAVRAEYFDAITRFLYLQSSSLPVGLPFIAAGKT